MRTLASVALLLALVPGSVQGAVDDADSLSRSIAPFIDSQTIAVLHADLARIDPDALAANLQEIDPRGSMLLDNFRRDLSPWTRDFIKAGGRHFFVVFYLTGSGSPSAFVPAAAAVVVPLEPTADAAVISRLLGSGDAPRPGAPPAQRTTSLRLQTARQLHGAVVGGDTAAVERLRTLEPVARPELARAFAAVPNTAVQFIVIPTADHRRAIEEVLPTLPPQIGGGPSTAITHGLIWAAVGMDPPPQMSLRAVVQSKDAAAAQALHGVVKGLVRFVAETPQVKRDLPTFDRLAPLLVPTVAGDRLTLSLDDPQARRVLADAVLPALWLAGGPARPAECQNKLRQFAVAIHAYHDKHKRFPPRASFDQQGRPLLNWRVHLLPLIGGEELYKQFHLDEPWDSEHNKKLIPRMPPVFRCPNQKTEEGKTCYVAPVGEKTMFPPDGKPLTFGDITDGTTNTILLVEVDDAHAVIWTKPDDLNYDPKNPLAGLVGHHEGGFNACFLDDSVRFVGEAVKPDVLRAAFTRNGGEPLGSDAFP